MAAELVTILHELVDEEVEISFGFDEEEDINVLVAGSTFMRRKLNRNDAFFEVVVPTYSVDEFKSHFRMTRGTLEKLCREVAATGTIPEGNRLIWKTANSCAVPGFGICLVYGQFRSHEIGIGSL